MQVKPLVVLLRIALNGTVPCVTTGQDGNIWLILSSFAFIEFTRMSLGRFGKERILNAHCKLKICRQNTEAYK